MTDGSSHGRMIDNRLMIVTGRQTTLFAHEEPTVSAPTAQTTTEAETGEDNPDLPTQWSASQTFPNDRKQPKCNPLPNHTGALNDH
jgi:hypothetical protein